ncbi:hypothetical protein MNBD_ACTINO01-116 [hydrothermal vent metagenome]|uniref:Integral membrane protein n=1 Tax=hydrothermal vent metagenome TaxID=652676 RepID=A0A3B0SRS3_9ZZZZ
MGMTDPTGVPSKENSPDHSYRAGGLDAPETGPVAGNSSIEWWRGTGVRALVRLGWQETKRLWNGRAPLHDIERRSVISRLFPQGVSRRQFFTRFASLMMLSTAIATFGILADSTAVVIGAMLVAPLMLPVLGGAAAIIMGWPRRIVSRALLITVGATLAVLLAAVISFVVPGHTDPLPAELMARTSPNLLDLGIALAAGAAGAYGQVKRHAADALTGVAVAVALVPPLAVVGITLQLTEWQLALGALLLFLANVVGIVIAAAATFLAAGFVPGRNPLRGHPQIVRGVSWAAIAAIIVVLPMQFGRGNVLPLSDPTDEVTVFVEEYVAERESSSEVVNVAVEVDGGVTEVDVVIASSFAPPSVNALAQRLAEYLSSPVEVRLLIVASETKRATVTP